VLPRRFALIRHIDYTGVSGVGVVAYGVAFADGQVVLRWCSTHPATSMWNSIDDMLAIHGHGEATSVEWIDAPYGDLEELPPTVGTRGRRRRREDRAAAHDTESGDNKGGEASVGQVARREVGDETPAATSAVDDTAPDTQAPNQLPVRIRQRLPGPGPAEADLDKGPTHPDATGESPGGRATLDEGVSSDAKPVVVTPPMEDPSPRRERPILRSVREEPKPAAAPLLTSSESDRRNGHLYIDTAPLLLTFRDSEDEPAAPLPRRRGGRHRRADPDAAG
jgi:hypothetical protein